MEQDRRVPAGAVGNGRGDPKDNRNFVSGVLWVLHSRAHWKDLPAEYGKCQSTGISKKSAHNRFTRRARAGVWERIFQAGLANPDNTYVMIDSTIVRAQQQAVCGKGEAEIRLWGVREED